MDAQRRQADGVRHRLSQTARRVWHEMITPGEIGYSGAGVVLALGDNVDGFKIGQTVAYAATGHAEIAAPAINHVVPVPDTSTCAMRLRDRRWHRHPGAAPSRAPVRRDGCHLRPGTGRAAVRPDRAGRRMRGHRHRHQPQSERTRRSTRRGPRRRSWRSRLEAADPRLHRQARRRRDRSSAPARTRRRSSTPRWRSPAGRVASCSSATSGSTSTRRTSSIARSTCGTRVRTAPAATTRATRRAGSTTPSVTSGGRRSGTWPSSSACSVAARSRWIR